MARDVCKVAPVVARRGCSVDICEHGTFHLTIGSVTLRLSGDALENVAAALGEAVVRIASADAATQDGHCH